MTHTEEAEEAELDACRTIHSIVNNDQDNEDTGDISEVVTGGEAEGVEEGG